MPRKQFTNAQKKEIVAYAAEHGVKAAMQAYNVSDNSIYAWKSRSKSKPTKNVNGHQPKLTKAQARMNTLRKQLQQKQAEVMAIKLQIADLALVVTK